MNFFTRWRHARKIRRTLRYVRRLKRALQGVEDARRSLKANEEYQPVCIGGVEDKMNWTEQARGELYFWLSERDWLIKKLGINLERAQRFA